MLFKMKEMLEILQHVAITGGQLEIIQKCGVSSVIPEPWQLCFTISSFGPQGTSRLESGPCCISYSLLSDMEWHEILRLALHPEQQG